MKMAVMALNSNDTMNITIEDNLVVYDLHRSQGVQIKIMCGKEVVCSKESLVPITTHWTNDIEDRLRDECFSGILGALAGTGIAALYALTRGDEP